jgi:hypothetical protein
MCSLDEAKTKTDVFDLSHVYVSRATFLEAHIQANELLVDAGREVALFFRDMLELGNYSLI